MFPYTTSLLLLALSLSAVTLLQYLRNPLYHLPGPWYTHFTSLPLKLATLSGRRIYFVHSLHQKYGPYVRISPSEVAVNDVKAFKQIHRIGSGGFEKSTWYRDLLAIGRPILFTMVGHKDHGARRRLFAKAFSKSNIRNNWEDSIKEKIELAVRGMGAEAAREEKVDMLRWWTFMASDASAHLMFGESFHTLESGEESEYLQRLQTGLVGMGSGAEFPLMRTIGRWIPLQISQRLFAVNGYLLDYANTAMVNMRSKGDGKTIFATIAAEAEKGENLRDIDVHCEATGLMIAGTDTTAITITYLIWAILKQPDLRRDLCEELSGIAEDAKDSDLEHLQLLNATIEEALRLYGALPGGLPRVAPHGGSKIGGYQIPEGTTVTTQTYSLHRDAELFPDPERFVVSRWMPGNENSKYHLSDLAKAAFSPWGAGSRTCLGLHIAYTELRLAALLFLQAFPEAKIAPSTTEKSMEMENFFLIRPAGHKCEVEL
ncbi:uncharacterized protein LTR77_010135 [Saxophila tyrrhenica]|uniref:Cytochrome P450 n=1 Tax=Saxophila tyrrhenica TaxID=1690608 RepID=A0AAV9NW08_9PEZI|nr:hypothetical protein LTR77_010135 [Saxophila tyrrhenica]